jgi:hypothetical protein
LQPLHNCISFSRLDLHDLHNIFGEEEGGKEGNRCACQPNFVFEQLDNIGEKIAFMKVLNANVKRWELSNISCSAIATNLLNDWQVSACMVIHQLYLDQSSSNADSWEKSKLSPSFSPAYGGGPLRGRFYPARPRWGYSNLEIAIVTMTPGFTV